MKWIKQLALAAAVTVSVSVQAQTIRNVTLPVNAKKEYRSATAIDVAGKDAPVVLLGNGQTGASLAITSCNAVTINGGFTMQPGASLNIAAGECAKAGQYIAQPVKNELSVYPNPAGDLVTVLVPAWSGKTTKSLIITDLSGKQVRQQNLLPGKTELDVSSLQRGAYLLVITGSGNTKEMRKLILQ